jgi:hypothetical protein
MKFRRLKVLRPNWAVETDALRRPPPSVAPVAGRRSPLRWAGGTQLDTNSSGRTKEVQKRHSNSRREQDNARKAINSTRSV